MRPLSSKQFYTCSIHVRGSKLNIFVVDQNPVVAAQDLCDKHVCKMGIESTQILCTVLWKLGVRDIPMKPTHVNHPCVKWAGESDSNFLWLAEHAVALFDEYSLRYGRRHASRDKLNWIVCQLARPPKGPLTPFVQCVKYDELRGPNPICAYRVYYFVDKSRFARWNHGRNPPEWWCRYLQA